MKNGSSLEQERQALLEQIHASRAVYRRMLTDENDEDQFAHETNALYSDPAHSFPRSMTVRWIMQHPFMTASAVIGLAALFGPTPIGRNVRRRTNGKVLTALVAVGTMAARNQPALQKYSKAVSVAAGFLQARRAKRAMQARGPQL